MTNSPPNDTLNEPPKHTNRLAEEKSPYLLQHAHNPVDWYPWGDEAIELARREDKPIFLSIGYSTCHWCHVMERESFENEAIAALINRYYVAIKVDREERPDVDRVYMSAVQAITGAGGWPLSAWLTPDLEPYFAGTYYPPERRHQQPGFADVLIQLRKAWDEQRDEVLSSSKQIADAVRQLARGPAGEEQSNVQASMKLAFEQILQTYDDELGGFGRAPKFPRPSTFSFLSALAEDQEVPEALAMVTESLRKMWAGGINDHLAGGYHRYSVDAFWRVSHFEKMLYDQAQMIWAFLEAHRLAIDPFFAEAARQTMRYLENDLQHADGGFYSAEDADSAPHADRPDEKEEGAFYLWELNEVEEIAGSHAPLAKAAFGLSSTGNTISDPQQEFGTRNVLYAALNPTVLSLEFFDGTAEVDVALAQLKGKLLERRNTRPRPHLDDKVITAWNGLTISALSRAGRQLGEQHWIDLAQRAADFLLATNAAGDDLRRRFRDGDSRFAGQLDDYANLALGLLDLYQATFAVEMLQASTRLAFTMIEKFADDSSGALFDSPANDPHLLTRSQDGYDGAEPSGNAIACEVLARLGALLHQDKFTARAQQIVQHFATLLASQPQTSPQLLASASLLEQPFEQVVLVGDLKSDVGLALLQALRTVGARRRVLLHVDSSSRGFFEGLDHPAAQMNEIRDLATAYVCRDFVCQTPTTSPLELEAQLRA